MVDATDTGIIGVRDRALVLLGFAGAFRRSELVALEVEDCTFGKDGLTVVLRRSKTDQDESWPEEWNRLRIEPRDLSGSDGSGVGANGGDHVWTIVPFDQPPCEGAGRPSVQYRRSSSVGTSAMAVCSGRTGRNAGAIETRAGEVSSSFPSFWDC
jgi:hypothetical protein